MKPARKPLAVLISAIGLGVATSTEAAAPAQSPALEVDARDWLAPVAKPEPENAHASAPAETFVAPAVFDPDAIDLELTLPQPPEQRAVAVVTEDLRRLACDEPNPSWPIDLCLPAQQAAGHSDQPAANDVAASSRGVASVAESVAPEPDTAAPLMLGFAPEQDESRQRLTAREQAVRLACNQPNPSWPIDLCWPERESEPSAQAAAADDISALAAAPAQADSVPPPALLSPVPTLDLVLTLPPATDATSSPAAHDARAGACDEPNPSWNFDLCFAAPPADHRVPGALAVTAPTAEGPVLPAKQAAEVVGSQATSTAAAEIDPPLVIDLVLVEPQAATAQPPQRAVENLEEPIATAADALPASATEQRALRMAEALLQQAASDPSDLTTPQRLLLALVARHSAPAMSRPTGTDLEAMQCRATAPADAQPEEATLVASWTSAPSEDQRPDSDRDNRRGLAMHSDPEPLDLVLAEPSPAPSAHRDVRAEDLIVMPTPQSAATTDADSGDRLAPSLPGWKKIAANHLDDVRGGFTTESGLRISFGIERAVYINGNLVTSTSFRVADLDRISAGQSPAIDPAMLTLIQNGAGNTFTATATPSAIGTAIQNTLNDQRIQNITVINATVNSLDILRSMNLQSTLRNAVSNSVGN